MSPIANTSGWSGACSRGGPRSGRRGRRWRPTRRPACAPAARPERPPPRSRCALRSARGRPGSSSDEPPRRRRRVTRAPMRSSTPSCAELARGDLRQPVAEGCSGSVPASSSRTPHVRGVDAPEARRRACAHQLPDLAGDLDAGGARADDGDRQPAGRRCSGSSVSSAISSACSSRRRRRSASSSVFMPGACSRPARRGRSRRPGARGDDQAVVGDVDRRPVGAAGLDDPRLQIEAGDLGQQHGGVSWKRRTCRSEGAISPSETMPVATWYSIGWNRWWGWRSMRVTSTGDQPSARVAKRPPKPPPTTTTRWRGARASAVDGALLQSAALVEREQQRQRRDDGHGRDQEHHERASRASRARPPAACDRQRGRQQVRVLRDAPGRRAWPPRRPPPGRACRGPSAGPAGPSTPTPQMPERMTSGSPCAQQAVEQEGRVAAERRTGPPSASDARRRRRCRSPAAEVALERLVERAARVEHQEHRRQERRARAPPAGRPGSSVGPSQPGPTRRGARGTRPEAMAPKLAPRKNGVTTDDSAKTAPKSVGRRARGVASRNANPMPRSTIPQRRERQRHVERRRDRARTPAGTPSRAPPARRSARRCWPPRPAPSRDR